VSKKKGKQVINEADVEVIDVDIRDEDYKGSDASSEAEELSQSYINEDEELDEETAEVEQVEAQLERDPMQSLTRSCTRSTRPHFIGSTRCFMNPRRAPPI